jgi:hypothetical protein
VTLSFHALWMVCALGAVVLAAAVRRNSYDAPAMALAFAAAAYWTGVGRLPDPVWAGAVAVLASAISLFRPRYATVSAVAGGVLAGWWTTLLEVQGLPSWPAVGAGLILLLVPMWLARTRPVFAPDVLREEGLLAVAVLGLGVASMPAILDGWQAAGNLSVTPERQVSTGIPTWTLTIILMSASFGGLYSFWSRR